MDKGHTILFEDKAGCLRLADRILKRYEGALGTGCFLELLQFSENRTYLVRDPAGHKRAVLRLCRPGYHTKDELQAEIEWLSALSRDTSSRSLNLPVPVADGDGGYVQSVAAEDGLIYNGVVFRYQTGRLLDTYTPEEQLPWFEKLGEVTAVLHRQVQGWNGSRNIQRFHWTYETMLGKRAIWGDWREIPRLTRQMYDILSAADRMVCNNLKAYGMDKSKYGLIHADLRASNLLTDGDRLRIIDFDDCGYGWFWQDLAASLSFIETLDIVPLLIAEWLKGYGRILEPGEEDRRMIPTFIMMRRLQLLAWVTSRRGSGGTQFPEDDFAAGTVELAERYLGGWLSGI